MPSNVSHFVVKFWNETIGWQIYLEKLPRSSEGALSAGRRSL